MKHLDEYRDGDLPNRWSTNCNKRSPSRSGLWRSAARTPWPSFATACGASCPTGWNWSPARLSGLRHLRVAYGCLYRHGRATRSAGGDLRRSVSGSRQPWLSCRGQLARGQDRYRLFADGRPGTGADNTRMTWWSFSGSALRPRPRESPPPSSPPSTERSTISWSFPRKRPCRRRWRPCSSDPELKIDGLLCPGHVSRLSVPAPGSRWPRNTIWPVSLPVLRPPTC